MFEAVVIPIPIVEKYPPPNTSKYPWNTLKVGESFLVPTGDRPQAMWQSLRSNCCIRNRKAGVRKFRAWLLDDGWVQVWREI